MQAGTKAIYASQEPYTLGACHGEQGLTVGGGEGGGSVVTWRGPLPSRPASPLSLSPPV